LIGLTVYFRLCGGDVEGVLVPAFINGGPPDSMTDMRYFNVKQIQHCNIK